MSGDEPKPKVTPAVGTAFAVWRVSPVSRVAGYAVATGIAAIGLGMMVGAVLTGDLGVALGFVGLGAVAFVLPAALAFRFLRRARVELTPRRLIVITTFSDYRVEWSDVVRATPGYSGVSILLSDGRVIVAGAVQKMNVSIWLNQHTRADELADLINARAGRTTMVEPPWP